MTPNAEGCAIVLAGHWNPRIFVPEWLIGRVTKQTEIRLEVQVGGPLQRYHFDGLVLTITDGQAGIGLHEVTRHSFEQAFLLAIKLLTELPHTPMIGAGVNLGFKTKGPDVSRLLDAFSFRDTAAISDAGFTIESVRLERRLRQNDQIVNVSLGFEGNEVVDLGLNFHLDTRTCAVAREYLERGFDHFLTRAQTLMQAVYKTDLNLGGNA
jgi:hypothetical protein